MFLFIFLKGNLGGNALDDCISRRILMRLPRGFLHDYRFYWLRFLFFVYDPVNKFRKKKKTKNPKRSQVKKYIYYECNMFSWPVIVTVSFNGF